MAGLSDTGSAQHREVSVCVSVSVSSWVGDQSCVELCHPITPVPLLRDISMELAISASRYAPDMGLPEKERRVVLASGRLL